MRRIRLTTRRLMVLIALVAVLLCVTVHGGREPGVYFRARGWNVGAWRDESTFRLDREFRPWGFTYFVGAATRDGGGVRGLLVEYTAGKVVWIAGRDAHLVW